MSTSSKSKGKIHLSNQIELLQSKKVYVPQKNTLSLFLKRKRLLLLFHVIQE